MSAKEREGLKIYTRSGNEREMADFFPTEAQFLNFIVGRRKEEEESTLFVWYGDIGADSFKIAQSLGLETAGFGVCCLRKKGKKRLGFGYIPLMDGDAPGWASEPEFNEAMKNKVVKLIPSTN